MHIMMSDQRYQVDVPFHHLKRMKEFYQMHMENKKKKQSY